jgi:CubicO group peptidase (beta-lactamase class C family)
MSLTDRVETCARTLVEGGPQVPGVPGAVVGLMVGDRRAVAAHGAADLPGGDRPMTVDLRHDLASVTKVLGTTSALVTLVGQRLLDLDAPARSVLPSFGGHDRTTVRELLLHRAGLAAWQPLYLAPGGLTDPAAVLDGLGAQEPSGSARCYSDLGFMQLGRIVAAVAGLPLERAIDELALAPLGIPGAGFRPGPDGVATSALDDRVERRMVATGEPHPVRWHDHGFAWRDRPVRGMASDGNCAHAWGGVAGHAGLFATVDELLDAGAALARAAAGGGAFDAATVRQFVTAGPDAEQALGFRVDRLGDGPQALQLVWHPGFTGCAVGFVPGRDIVAAMATNRLLVPGEPAPTVALWATVRRALLDELGISPIAA